DASPEGLYHNDTRYLSGFQFLIDGAQPILLSSTIRDDNAMLAVDLTNPDLVVNNRVTLPADTIHIGRSKFLWQGACYERIAVRNFDIRQRIVRLGFVFAADFADIFEVRGHRRPARGESRAHIVAADTVCLEYLGLDGLARRTLLRFDPAPDSLDVRSAAYAFGLDSRAQKSVFVSASCLEGADVQNEEQRFFPCMRRARRALRRSTAHATTVETSNAIFNEVLCRAMADLFMLMTHTDGGVYPYAGIPWFSTPFGRDGIITAMELLWANPDIARGVLKFLASSQSHRSDATADAEPGKILHECRQGEMARLGEVPFGRYYGAVDTTPLYVMLAGMYFRHTGDLAFIAELWPAIEAALAWIDTHGDPDGDGLVEYQRQRPGGLVNQGWKDSQDSVFHADGALATGAIALCEVQGYAYAARRYAAALARELGQTERAVQLEQRADADRIRFESAFWSEQLGMYALALDGEKKRCEVCTSNAGQVLFTGIAAPERAARVADALMGAELHSGWGIRTVATSSARFNPMSYHNGSVWPHDNALIALGLARYGLTSHVERLFCGLFDAAGYMDLRRLPELFCGFARTPGSGPTLYPVACSPQAWSSAAPFALLQACLGMDFDHRAAELRFRRPRLPPFLEQVTLRSLRVGEDCMDIELCRHQHDVSVNVLRREGNARLVITL
ncbi:MAG TPA: amylo-alpha-1,6-glucosidase, partial [Burkholderiales bacterium]|nr:amylo-alpha-1,6-glucosidase [Burkholderiales bacterium]